MSYKVIRSFILKTNSTRNDVILNVPVNLNPNKEYYLKLMSFRFSNVFANLVGDIIISPNNTWTYTYNNIDYTIPESRYLTPALGELDVLYNWMKTIIKNQCNCTDDEITISINSYGKIDFIFSSNFSNINFVGGCLNLNYFGKIGSITTNDTTSINIPVVSSFNSILLTCSLVGSSTYVQNESGSLSPTSVICSVNAATKPFELLDYTAVQAVMFPLNSASNITAFTCELRDDNNLPLTQLPGSSTDYNLWLEIVERL